MVFIRTELNSALIRIEFCVLDIGIIPSLFLLMYSQVILSDEKPALSSFKEHFLLEVVNLYI